MTIPAVVLHGIRVSIAAAVIFLCNPSPAAAQLRVGYYDMLVGAGVISQRASIEAAGLTNPVALTDLRLDDLKGIDVLVVQNPINNGYGMEYLLRFNQGQISAAVNAGMVLVVHDRRVGTTPAPPSARNILPGASAITFTRLPGETISFLDPALTGEPGGALGGTDLNSPAGGEFAHHGFATITSLPLGARVLLGTGTAGQAVTFSYPFGNGAVVYSTIPLDGYLAGSGANPPRDNFALKYAPNVVAYAATLRVPQPTTLSVNSVAGLYGGKVTLTATLRSGQTNLFGIPVQFSFTDPLPLTNTNVSGVATVLNVSLGTLDAGTYPVSATAAFTSSAGAAEVTVLRAPATITAVGGTFDYDGRPHPASGTVTGVVVGGVPEPLGTPSFLYTDVGSGETTATPPTDAGVYAVTALYEGSVNYLSGSHTTQTITIRQVPLTVAADNARRLAGTANPVFDVIISGLVLGEGPEVLGGTLTVTTDAAPDSPAGTYTLTPGGVTSRNYAITFVPGTLTVNPFVVIDRTTIDTGIAGLLAQAINADIAAKGLRTPLFTRPAPSAPQGLVLPAGYTFNPGLFKFAEADPQRSVLARWWPNAGLPFTIPEFVASAGAAALQFNLIAVESVVPLTVADMEALVGKTTCAVVYDSNILAFSIGGLSIGNLTGKTLGITAFTVTAVTPHPSGGYHLPSITVNVLDDAQAVCQ